MSLGAPSVSLAARGRAARGGCFAKILVVLSLTLVACVLAWIFLLPSMVTRVIESRTGFGVQVKSLSINPFTSRVAIEGLVITNPSDSYSESGFVQLNSFRADAELGTLLSEKIVLEEAVVDIDKITLVRNAKGDLNGVEFGKRLAGESSAAPAKDEAKPEPAKPAAKKEFLIRKLKLRLDTISIVDASGSKASTRDLKLGFNQEYENVTGVTQIATPIVSQMISNGGSIAAFAKDLGKDAYEAAKKGGQDLKEAGKAAGETIKGIFQSISDKTKK